MNADDLLQEALAGEALSVVAICERGSVSQYAATGDSRAYAPAGPGALMNLLSEAARRSEAGVFGYRDPDRRTPGIILIEPIESARVVVGITLGERDVAVLRLRVLAQKLRSLG